MRSRRAWTAKAWGPGTAKTVELIVLALVELDLIHEDKRLAHEWPVVPSTDASMHAYFGEVCKLLGLEKTLKSLALAEQDQTTVQVDCAYLMMRIIWLRLGLGARYLQ